jgi:hypothetical protein
MSKKVESLIKLSRNLITECPNLSLLAHNSNTNTKNSDEENWRSDLVKAYKDPKLRLFAKNFAIPGVIEADDLLNDAVIRALNKGHASLSAKNRLISCMKSIASTYARSAYRASQHGYAGNIDLNDLEVHWHSSSYVDPERECQQRWRTHFIALVYEEVAANDNVIEKMLDALADNKRGKELQSVLSLSATEYESKRKKLQRKVRSHCAKYVVNGRLHFDMPISALKGDNQWD